MADTPLPSHQPLPTPRRSWMKTAFLGMILLVSGMVIGSGLTVIGMRRFANELRQRPDMFSNRILARMESDLKLTKPQKAELSKIFKETREDLDEMRGQHRVQGQAFFRDFHDKVTRVLTPAQQEEWETWWKQARERAFKERSGGPQKPGGSSHSPREQLRSVEELKKQSAPPTNGAAPESPKPETQAEPKTAPSPN